MPIYEYEREDGSVFEVMQKINDPALSVCPSTGQKVIKKISASLPIFNGSGFYKTDYCSNGNSAKSKSTESNSSDSKTETKPKSCGSGCGCH